MIKIRLIAKKEKRKKKAFIVFSFLFERKAFIVLVQNKRWKWPIGNMINTRIIVTQKEEKKIKDENEDKNN